MRLGFFRRGFTVVELITAIVMIGGVAGAGTYFISTSGTLRNSLQASSAREVFASQHNDAARHGVDPDQIFPFAASLNDIAGGGTTTGGNEDVNRSRVLTVSSTLFLDAAPGKASVLGVTASTGNTKSRSTGFGLNLSTSTAGSGLPPGQSGLLVPPMWPSGLTTLHTTNFPYTADLIYPTNPPGTVYRYTLDGTEPTESSPMWAATNYPTAEALPSIMKARAFNPDPTYLPSVTVTVVPAVYLVADYRRMDGTVSTSFSYLDITGTDPVTGLAGTTNWITLGEGSNLDPSNYDLHFTTDGSLPTAASPIYPGSAFVPDAADPAWVNGGILLRVVAVSKNPLFRNSRSADYTLTPVLVDAAAPEIKAYDKTGTLVAANTDLEAGFTVDVTATGANTVLTGTEHYTNDTIKPLATVSQSAQVVVKSIGPGL